MVLNLFYYTSTWCECYQNLGKELISFHRVINCIGLINQKYLPCDCSKRLTTSTSGGWLICSHD